MRSGLKRLYEEKFSEHDKESRRKVWESFCANFLKKWIPSDSVVLDLGAGQCEFINCVRAKRKYAVDLNEYIANFANPDVTTLCESVMHVSLPDVSVDVVFSSNLLEHMNSREEILDTLSEAYRVCKPGGRVLLLFPNIRYIGGGYWDFFDHQVPLSDRSISEALKIVGFEIEKVYPRLLPYAMRKALRIPNIGLLVRIYLAIPLAWKVLGKQSLIIGRKSK